jgi:hypothetical protein
MGQSSLWHLAPQYLEDLHEEQAFESAEPQMMHLCSAIFKFNAESSDYHNELSRLLDSWRK